MEEQASISQISRNMGIYDSFFALPFGKIGIYGLISPRFCGMGSGHSTLGSYSLQSSLCPISIFPLPDFQRKWRFLALPHGINYMGSEMHSPVYIFVLLLPLISPLGLEVYGFSILLLDFLLVGNGLLPGSAQALVGRLQ